MNILEAIKSGKRFRRKEHGPNCGWESAEDYSLSDIMMDDWELEEEKKELSWTQIEEALIGSDWILRIIKIRLGFKE